MHRIQNGANNFQLSNDLVGSPPEEERYIDSHGNRRPTSS